MQLIIATNNNEISDLRFGFIGRRMIVTATPVGRCSNSLTRR
jgi:hypothetical protein